MLGGGPRRHEAGNPQSLLTKRQSNRPTALVRRSDRDNRRDEVAGPLAASRRRPRACPTPRPRSRPKASPPPVDATPAAPSRPGCPEPVRVRTETRAPESPRPFPSEPPPGCRSQRGRDRNAALCRRRATRPRPRPRRASLGPRRSGSSDATEFPSFYVPEPPTPPPPLERCLGVSGASKDEGPRRAGDGSASALPSCTPCGAGLPAPPPVPSPRLPAPEGASTRGTGQHLCRDRDAASGTTEPGHSRARGTSGPVAGLEGAAHPGLEARGPGHKVGVQSRDPDFV